MAHSLADLYLAAKWRIGGASIAGFPTGPFYVMYHNGDPGPNGTANVLLGGRRQVMSNAPTGPWMVSSGVGTGQVATAADTIMTAIASAIAPTAVSVWGGAGAATGPSGGTLMHTGPASGSVPLGGDAKIPAGTLTDTCVITG